MKTSIMLSIGSATSGLIAATLGSLAVGHSGSKLLPLIAYFFIVSFILLVMAGAKGLWDME